MGRAAGVLVGAVAYTYHDIFFSPKGYLWVFIWYSLCVVDSVIMKHVADTVPMTTWSRAYYNVPPPPPPPPRHRLHEGAWQPESTSPACGVPAASCRLWRWQARVHLMCVRTGRAQLSLQRVFKHF